MMPKCLAIAALLLTSQAVAQSRPSPSDPRKYWLNETRGQVDGVNYDSLLDRSMQRDSGALSQLFELKGLDGAGADGHSQVLWALLWHWGDRRFAAILRHEPDSVRTKVTCDLDYAADANYSGKFPQTFAVTHHDPHCRGW